MGLIRERMRIVKYVPKQFFGFVEDDKGDQVFFHIRAFQWGEFSTFPPPVIGEDVDVQYDPTQRKPDRAPKAWGVYRLREPTASFGTIDVFHEKRGYGFIKTNDGRAHYLHRSEMMDGQYPMPGRVVTFFEGFHQGRSRACFVSLSEDL